MVGGVIIGNFRFCRFLKSGAFVSASHSGNQAGSSGAV